VIRSKATAPISIPVVKAGSLVRLGLGVNQVFKNVLAWRAQEEQGHKHNERCQVQRDQEDAPESQTTVPSPERQQKRKGDINRNVQGGDGWHGHDGRAALCRVLSSYLSRLGVTTSNRCLYLP